MSLPPIAGVRLLCFDVDGTLTDGRMTMLPDGGFLRAYHAQDGQGISLFLEAGGIVAIITAAEPDVALQARARHLGVLHLYENVGDKLEVVNKILRAESLTPQQAAFVGDDLPDVAAMRAVGFAAAPPGAVAEARAAAHYITQAPAGGGAAREVCDLLLAAKK